MNFDWQTEQEQEDVWETEHEAKITDRSPRRRRWLALLAVAALLLVTGLLVRREAKQRVEDATALVEEEVISSHTLGLQAARSGDDELFVTLLSGREPAWTEAQKALLEAGLLYDQAARPFGLEAAGEPQVGDVSFSPDLRAAELQMTQRYAADTGVGEDSVILQRTLVYREGQQRWLLAPPEAEFWGSWDSVTQGALTVDYPVRDQEVALRLATDLTRMLDEMCETLEELACTAGWWMRLRLEKDPESLLALGEAEAAVPTGPDVRLPSPSLVGLPVDDVAYDALFRGYARHLAAAAIGDLVGWECCGEGTLFYQALLQEQLAQLALRPAPAPLGDYIYLVDEGVTREGLFTAVRRYWNESTAAPPGEEISLVVYAFLAFLDGEEMALAAAEMQRALDDARSLIEWVEPAGRDGRFEERLGSAFQAFARQRIEEAGEQVERPPGLSAPQEELLLACGGESGGYDLYRYDLAAGNWSLEVDLNAGYIQMVGGDPKGTVAVLAYDEGADGILIQNLIWRPRGGTRGKAIRVAGPNIADVDQVWLPLAYGPGGELAVFLYTLPVEESEPSAGLVDVDTCRPGGCDVEPLPGLPLWSPSGAHLLALDIFQEEITLYSRPAGARSWQEVGRAWAPIWLDNETYAYVPYAGEVRLGSLYAAPVVGGEPQQLVPAEDLTAALPAGLAGRRPAVSWALPHPQDENQLLVAARNQARGGQLLFTIERAAGETSWLDASLTVTFVEHFEETENTDWIGGWFDVQGVVSPDGRWLLLPLEEPASSDGGIFDGGTLIYDLQNREPALQSHAGTTSSGFLGPTHSWSPNGAWLARPVAGMVDVIAPAFRVDGRPYRQLIVHDFDACVQALWVDE